MTNALLNNENANDVNDIISEILNNIDFST